jgi:aminoglycoside N3'-acetyltransferase
MLREVIPDVMKGPLRQVRRLFRRLGFRARRFAGGEQVGAAEIADALHELGIRSGDDVLLHSSMRGLGVIAGGADAVVQAVREVIGAEGTLLVPAYPLASTMVEHLRTPGIALDARNTPSQMGKISETVRLLPGSRRSLHPTHSVAAVGPRAGWYCEGHERSATPCGPESPHAKLADKAGWIVALGSTIGKITSYHVLEDRAKHFPLPVYLPEDFSARVIDESGRELLLKVKSHNPEVSRRRIDNTREIEAAFETLLQQRGVLHKVEVGTGAIWAMRADRLELALEELLGQGITIYDVSKVTGDR